jgi:hypothetical protein
LPIFDDLVHPRDLWPANARWPIRRAGALLARFHEKFPEIHYDLHWEARLLNAQAFIGLRGRHVRLYGGLGRHRKIGLEGMAFAIAHETGHHLGGSPSHQFYSSLSSEARADEWAIYAGLPIVFGGAVARRFVDRGLLQLAAVWPRYSAKPRD